MPLKNIAKKTMHQIDQQRQLDLDAGIFFISDWVA